MPELRSTETEDRDRIDHIARLNDLISRVEDGLVRRFSFSILQELNALKKILEGEA